MRERMSRARRWAYLLGGLAVIILFEQAWRHGHDYVIPEKFRVVEAGKIYRGAWQKPYPMRKILKDYRIKTVIALAHMPDDPMPVAERALAESMGVRWIHVPIYYDSRDPGNADAMGDRLERAAALVADPANQPVYFHCHHGVNRASMVQIAYRTLYCDYSLDQAQAEIAQMTGWKYSALGTGEEYMNRFYRERVETRRRAAAEAVARADAGATPR